jgi:hypothetical protein
LRRKAWVPEPVYIVGFPKSGNTWLVRLVADTLIAPVRDGAMEDSPELAAEINASLHACAVPEYETLKIHYLPEVFFAEIDPNPRRIVYIYRDVRDVAISSFFYFEAVAEADAEKMGFARLATQVARKGPRYVQRHWKARRKLMRYIQDWCLNGVLAFGTWSQHIREWRMVASTRSCINMSFISYENLLKDTEHALRKLVGELGLPRPSGSRLREAVARQSFGEQKKRFATYSVTSEMPFSPQFQMWFLRRGISGDWKRFLSPQMERVIYRHHGITLMELGYRPDNDRWWTA